MNLLLDIGNHWLKWATVDASGLFPGGRLRHEETADELLAGIWPMSIPPQRIIVSNVAGNAMAEKLREQAGGRWGIDVEFVVAQTQAHGVRCAYDKPERLGPDRWAALVGARQRYPGRVCVVDLGTAITVDVMDEDGRHVGGLIAPGIGLMRRALLSETRDIAGHSENPIPLSAAGWLAQDTRAAVDRGAMECALGLCDRVMSQLHRLWPDGAFSMVLTGGDSANVVGHLTGNVIHDPDLVLHGLAFMGRE